MTSVVAKTVMKAIKANNVALIKSLAQRSRMSPGKLMSKAKKYSMKKKSKPKKGQPSKKDMMKEADRFSPFRKSREKR